MKTCIIGASGYTGAELARLVSDHPQLQLSALFVSANSVDANKSLDELYPTLRGKSELKLLPLPDEKIARLANQFDLIFLATPHEFSHTWVPQLTGKKAKVIDLSGAFRLSDTVAFERYYGFPHQHPEAIAEAVYGLAEWYADDIANAQVIAVPGCYPTASLIATKPLVESGLISQTTTVVINAVSGVSGAGRKSSLANSFCEVSLQAYGILAHRHTPEIAAFLQRPVVFTPHLGSFKRGILATVTCPLKPGVSQQQVEQAYADAYANKPLIRMFANPVKLDDVIAQPYCDLHWQFSADNGYIVITAAIDNLLKGAASQAIQCANLSAGYAPYMGLIRE